MAFVSKRTASKTFCPFIQLVCVIVLMGFLTTGALAQSYPRQTIKIIVPFPPGGGVDVVARVIAPRLGEMLGQSVIVQIGAVLGARSVPRSSRKRQRTATRSYLVPGARTAQTRPSTPSSATMRCVTLLQLR